MTRFGFREFSLAHVHCHRGTDKTTQADSLLSLRLPRRRMYPNLHHCLLLSRASSKPLTPINTHLDHLSDEQRRYGASLLLIRGRYEAATSKGPVLLAGDFNNPPTGGNSGAYRVITGKVPPGWVGKRSRETYDTGKDQLPDFRFLDTRAETPRFGVSENFATFTGWSPTVTEEWARINFVLGASCRRWCVPFPLGRGMHLALPWLTTAITVQDIYRIQGRCRDE